jgi:hypothetical protein
MQPVTIQKFSMTREDVLEAIADWLTKRSGKAPLGIPVATVHFTNPTRAASLTHLSAITLEYHSGG